LLALVHPTEIAIFNEQKLLSKIDKIKNITDLVWINGYNKLLVLRQVENKQIVELFVSQQLLQGHRFQNKPGVIQLDTYVKIHAQDLPEETVNVEVVNIT